MSQTQYLLSLIAIIPLLNCFCIAAIFKQATLVNIISKFSPILFLAILIGISGGIGHSNSLTLLTIDDKLSLAFAINRSSLKFLFLLNFLWLIFAFYSHAAFKFSNYKETNSLKLFTAIIFSLITLIAISKNLISLLLFYNCLIFASYIFAIKFLNNSNDSKLINCLFYFQNIALFLTVFICYKFIGNIDFIDENLISHQGSYKYLLLIVAIFLGLFPIIALPFYFFYRNLKIDLIFIYLLFFLSYGVVGILVIAKLINVVFDSEILFNLVQKIGFGFFESFFLFNILIASSLVIISKTIKTSFFYLLIQQLIFTLFSILIFAVFDNSKVELSIMSFCLNLTLIFICLSNIMSYLNKAENKAIKGLFYNLITTASLLFFGILGLIGAVPSVSFLEKFSLLKIIFNNNLEIAKIIFAINIIAVIIFAIRIFYPLFSRSEVELKESDLALARKIDLNSSLILCPVLVLLFLILAIWI